MDGQFEFYAFISYSHRDLKWGKWLQNRLENYRLPAAINAQFEEQPPAMKVFRDQTDLAGNELESSLFRTLDRARNLVVICSPNSAKSPYVEQEIAYFKSIGRADRIFAFVVSGEPNSDTPELECLNPALRDIDVTNIHNVCELGRDNAFFSLFAALLDIRYDQIAIAERRRKARRIAVSSALGAAVLAISIAAGIYLKTERDAQKAQSRDLYFSALYYFNDIDGSGQYGKALEYGIQAAEAGNDNAMDLLGTCYMYGIGTKEEPEKALYWSRKSAESGNASGMNSLGFCYQYGIGTDENPEQAVYWFRKAAESGNCSGMSNLGYCYDLGFGTEKDLNQAFYWYGKAAELGESAGMNNLGYCYQYGLGTGVDLEQAVYWYQIAVDNGNIRAMKNLALLFLDNSGSDADVDAGYYWLQRAAEAGDEEAMNMIHNWQA